MSPLVSRCKRLDLKEVFYTLPSLHNAAWMNRITLELLLHHLLPPDSDGLYEFYSALANSAATAATGKCTASALTLRQHTARAANQCEAEIARSPVLENRKFALLAR